MPGTPHARSNSFDALRLLGSILVIIGHSYVLTGTAAPSFAGVPLHTLGVQIFFVISGYLITASYIRDTNLIRFSTRRALRIMPALIAVLLLTVAIMAFVTTADFVSYSQGAIEYVARNSLLLPFHALPGVFVENPHPEAVNGSLWTLPVEAFMYALTPLLVLARPRLAPVLVAGALLATPITATVFGFGLTGASHVIPYFLLGAFMQMNITKLPAWVTHLSLGVILLASVVSAPEVITAVPLTVLVLRIGESSWLSGLPADISYGMYLLAFPAQQLIIVLYPEISPLTLCLATVAAITPLALLSWHWIESPALSLARQWMPRAPIVKDT